VPISLRNTHAPCCKVTDVKSQMLVGRVSLVCVCVRVCVCVCVECQISAIRHFVESGVCGA
jgi:hypothetical protein